MLMELISGHCSDGSHLSYLHLLLSLFAQGKTGFGKGSSINDVTLNWTFFSHPKISQSCLYFEGPKHKILDPLPLTVTSFTDDP
jgi:hypothetical protein